MNTNTTAPAGAASGAQLGADDTDAMFADFPPLTPGCITYGTLLAIVEWRKRHGLDCVSKGTVRACRGEGQPAGQAGLELGLIDYGQATGDTGF